MAKVRHDPRVAAANRQGLISKPGVNRVSIDALLNGAHEMVIVHAGEEYRLRITSKGKLILTK